MKQCIRGSNPGRCFAFSYWVSIKSTKRIEMIKLSEKYVNYQISQTEQNKKYAKPEGVQFSVGELTSPRIWIFDFLRTHFVTTK